MSIKYKFRDDLASYFVTTAVVQWVDVFTRNEYRQVVIDSLNYCIKNKGLIVKAWVLMSNHIHLIVSLNDTAENTLADIMRDFKKFTAMQLIKSIKENPQESRKGWMLAIFEQAGNSNSQNTKFQFWRHDNHPIELVDNKRYEKAVNYIHQNPVQAGLVSEVEHYNWSSAFDYTGKKGFVDVSID